MNQLCLYITILIAGDINFPGSVYTVSYWILLSGFSCLNHPDLAHLGMFTNMYSEGPPKSPLSPYLGLTLILQCSVITGHIKV